MITRYLLAKTGEIPAKAIFLGWRLRPVRDPSMTLDEWFEGIKKKYPAYQVEKEYPETESHFLSDALSIKFFNTEGIDFIRRDCFPPIETDFDGMVRIWAKPEVGLNYCAFLDPSDGSDPHAFGIMDSVAKRVVLISHGKCPAEKCAEIFDKYVRIYNNAFNEFELNNFAGQRVAEVLLELGTPNRRSTIVEGRKNKFGWWTGGNSNSNKNVRTLMLTTLEEAVRNKGIRVHYSAVPAEMDSMIKPDDGGPRVPSGKHDDLLLMLGGLLIIRKESREVDDFSSMFHCYSRS